MFRELVTLALSLAGCHWSKLEQVEFLQEVLKTQILSGKTPCRLVTTDVSEELVCSLLLEYFDPDGVCRKILQARP
jgi:hypothetical protein